MRYICNECYVKPSCVIETNLDSPSKPCGCIYSSTTNHAIWKEEKNMNSEDCNNYKPTVDHDGKGGLSYIYCKNFKSKEHELDIMILELCKIDFHTHPDKFLKKAKELRYASIKWWVTDVNGWKNTSDSILQTEMKKHGREGWII